MITFFHGDDIAHSRQDFLATKNLSQGPYAFEGEKVSLTDLVQIIDGGGLFATEKHIFIENFFSKRKQSSEMDAIIDYLKKNTTATVYFWETKELGKKHLGLFKGAVEKKYKLPQQLFAFLDSLGSRNQTSLIQTFHQTIATTETELVFFMLVRHIRILLAMSDKAARQTIDEVARLAPWQKTKLERQARLFTPSKLLTLHNTLYRIDNAQKTGASPLTLTQSIDFLLLGI